MSEAPVATTAPASTKRRKTNRKSRRGSYTTAHLRVIRTFRADVRCKKTTAAILDDIVHHIIHRVRESLMLLQVKTGSSRITLNDMVTAVKIVVGRGELIKHALAEGGKSVEHYNAHKRGLSEKRASEKKTPAVKAQ